MPLGRCGRVGMGTRLVHIVAPEPKTTGNRVHLDLATGSAADPEGNEFCVLTPR